MLPDTRACPTSILATSSALGSHTFNKSWIGTIAIFCVCLCITGANLLGISPMPPLLWVCFDICSCFNILAPLAKSKWPGAFCEVSPPDLQAPRLHPALPDPQSSERGAPQKPPVLPGTPWPLRSPPSSPSESGFLGNLDSPSWGCSHSSFPWALQCQKLISG